MADQEKANAPKDPHYERLPLQHTFWDDKWRQFTVALVMAVVMLQILFILNIASVYGTLFQQSSRYHALNVLEVNLDVNNSIVQSSLATAYSKLQSNGFIGVDIQSSVTYPTLDSAREAVCQGHYWAAVVVNPNATSRLTQALAGGYAAAAYKNTSAMTIITNSAKYPADTAIISGQLQALVGAATTIFSLLDPTAIHSLNTSDTSAVSAFRSPFLTNQTDIMPTTQGGRVFYNDILMVLPVIQIFVFLMALNGVSEHFKLHTRLNIPTVLTIRWIIAFIYTWITALVQTGLIWAFKENWGVTGKEFAITWMVLWLYCIVQWAVLDTASAFIKLAWFGFFFVTWVCQNVLATIAPYEVTPGFYRWTYALPSRNTYDTLVSVWAGGCDPVIYRTLPILFAYAFVFIILAVLGQCHRCRVAVREEKAMLEAAAKVLNEQGWPRGSTGGGKNLSDSESASDWDAPAAAYTTGAAHAAADHTETPHSPIAFARGALQTLDVSRPIAGIPDEEPRSAASMGPSMRMPFADTVEGFMSNSHQHQR